MWGSQGTVDLIGASIGGGRINIYSIDGFDVSVDGSYSVLMTRHRDEPGVIAEITRVLAHHHINIAFLDVSRKVRGSDALLIAETDDPLPREAVDHVSQLHGVMTVRSLPCF